MQDNNEHNTEEYSVYGKLDCDKTDLVISILKDKGLNYVYLELDKHYTMKNIYQIMYRPDFKELPVIFKNHKFFGGANFFCANIDNQ